MDRTDPVHLPAEPAPCALTLGRPLGTCAPEGNGVWQPLAAGRETGAPNAAPARAIDDPAAMLVRLEDGATVRLRPARADDAERLRRMFFGLSDETRYLYFCAGIPANETWADRFVALGRADGQSSYALVAEPTEAPDCADVVIGLARFVRRASGQSAEIGLLLADSWQSRGLGRFVLQRLRIEARRRAVAVFTGSVLWENRRMLRLARRVFPNVQIACTQGTCDLTMALG